jgi:hypothetical protein
MDEDKVPVDPKEEAEEQEPKQVEKLDEAGVLDKLLSSPEDELLHWEHAQLPSEGKYYDGMVPDGKIQVRPMGMHADKILATQRLAATGESIDYLFKECVRFPDDEFNPLNLLVGDRIFLLYYLRGITYGNEYEFAWTCPNQECKATSVHEYDLNLLYDTKISPNPDLPQEPFKVVLPELTKWSKENGGDEFWVEVRLMRGYDLRAIMRTMRTKKSIKGGVRTKMRQKKGKPKQNLPTAINFSEAVSDNLRMLIHSVMGDKDPFKVNKVVERLHSKDAATIREYLRDNSPGIDTQVEITCPSCGEQATAELPITETFFRPTPSRGS